MAHCVLCGLRCVAGGRGQRLSDGCLSTTPAATPLSTGVKTENGHAHGPADFDD
jgi:hypothetical protein